MGLKHNGREMELIIGYGDVRYRARVGYRLR